MIGFEANYSDRQVKRIERSFRLNIVSHRMIVFWETTTTSRLMTTDQ